MPLNKFPAFTGLLLNKANLKDAANALGVSYKTFYNKLNGITQFTWREVCILHDTFFPNFTIDEIFDRWKE